MGGFFYGRYTKEQVERANQVDLEELLLRSGEKLLRSGREKRLESDHSVTIRGNEWYDHAAEEGGFALSFARKHFGLSFQEAMALLLGENGQAPLPKAKPKPAPEPSEPFALPPAAGNQRRVFGYLLGTRQIDCAVLTAFVRKGVIYEDLPYHNAVFVGLDTAGVPRHAHKRSTNSEGKPFRLNVGGKRSGPQLPLDGNQQAALCVRSPHRPALLYHGAPGGLAAAQLCGPLRGIRPGTVPAA